MITVIICKDKEGNYKYLRCVGHAGYDDQGRDIVCAAVSVLIINTINSITKFTKDLIAVIEVPETPNIEFEFSGIPSEKAVLLMDSMMLGLEEIEHNYGEDFIQLILKEV